MLIEDTPDTQVRSDLWNTMSIGELTKQQELLVTKISHVSRMIDHNVSPTILSLYQALQYGLADINKLIESKTSEK